METANEHLAYNAAKAVGVEPFGTDTAINELIDTLSDEQVCVLAQNERMWPLLFERDPIACLKNMPGKYQALYLTMNLKDVDENLAPLLRDQALWLALGSLNRKVRTMIVQNVNEAQLALLLADRSCKVRAKAERRYHYMPKVMQKTVDSYAENDEVLIEQFGDLPTIFLKRVARQLGAAQIICRNHEEFSDQIVAIATQSVADAKEIYAREGVDYTC
ncbi:hypothetical protein [Actinomyces vulturis]|uniref:hypothetical protein n=1 Tax=Actinomyces vulturis TaxID=1857645 RepID=UPI00082E97A3|nr:hypothetical protein [Actinomyces vulturis]